MIDATHIKAHRSAAGAKGGSRSRLLAARAEGATRRFIHSRVLRDDLSPYLALAFGARSKSEIDLLVFACLIEAKAVDPSEPVYEMSGPSTSRRRRFAPARFVIL